jgi:hypothetical protein
LEHLEVIQNDTTSNIEVYLLKLGYTTHRIIVVSDNTKHRGDQDFMIKNNIVRPDGTQNVEPDSKT